MENTGARTVHERAPVVHRHHIGSYPDGARAVHVLPNGARAVDDLFVYVIYFFHNLNRRALKGKIVYFSLFPVFRFGPWHIRTG